MAKFWISSRLGLCPNLLTFPPCRGMKPTLYHTQAKSVCLESYFTATGTRLLSTPSTDIHIETRSPVGADSGTQTLTW